MKLTAYKNCPSPSCDTLLKNLRENEFGSFGKDNNIIQE